MPGIVSDERKKQRTLLGFPACVHASREKYKEGAGMKKVAGCGGLGVTI